MVTRKGIVKKLLFFFGILFLCAGQTGGAASAREEIFNQDEERFIASLDVLKVGYVQDRIPISYTDAKTGGLGGVSRAVFDRIQEISGLRFLYQELPEGDVTYDYLTGEKFDLVTSVEYNEQNKKANGILMSNPYLYGRKVIVGHEGVTLEENQNLKIAVATGSQTLKKVLKKQYPNFKIVDYRTIGDCFEAVNDGEADFLLQNQYVAEHQMYKPKYENLKVLPTVGLDDKLCFSAVVPLGKEASAELTEKKRIIQILDKAIAQISEDELANYIIEANMENQYHDSVGDFLYRYRYTAAILLIMLALVCVLLVILLRLHTHAVRAEADAEARMQFLSMMSHEIRTPLNGLLGLNYLITHNLGDEKKMKHYLKQSSDVEKYLITLVNDILEMSKIQKKQMKLECKAFSLDNTIAVVSAVTSSQMREKGIRFTIQKEISQDRLMGDRVRVEQVVLNVLDNACKYTSRGGSVAVEITQNTHTDGKICTHIVIKDTGCGMSDEFQRKIFDAFTRESNEVSKGNQGTGLGMAISRSLAQMMGGNLTVRSKLGRGSTFTFTFVTEAAGERSEEPEEESLESQESKGYHVLVAEDNELNAEIVMDLLEAQGCIATLAVDGKEAVKRFAVSPVGTFDCILMDIMMPVQNGFEAAREIRSLDRPDASAVQIIACTANAFEEDRQKALESGMNDFVAKPIDVEILMQKLRAHMEERKGKGVL